MSTTMIEPLSYTLDEVCQQLRLPQEKVLGLCQTLDIQPYPDPKSGTLLLSGQGLALLKQSVETQLQSTGRSLATATTLPAQTRMNYMTSPSRNGALSRTDLSVIVESVSHAKEEILKDLSHLLDDKLAGLDDVVVELIRSKSENDALREEIKRLEDSRDHYQRELTKFRPAAFGFYRKDG